MSWKGLEDERELVIEYLAYAARSFPPNDANRAIESAAQRLVDISYAELQAIAREDAEG